MGFCWKGAYGKQRAPRDVHRLPIPSLNAKYHPGIPQGQGSTGIGRPSPFFLFFGVFFFHRTCGSDRTYGRALESCNTNKRSACEFSPEPLTRAIVKVVIGPEFWGRSVWVGTECGLRLETFETSS